MKKVIATAGVVGLAALAFQTAEAAVLIGTLSKSGNSCPTAIGALNGDDCSYNDSFSQAGTSVGIDPWVGPGRSGGFYTSTLSTGPLGWSTEPGPGDGKVHPSVTANLTIGAGNVVSGTIVIGAVAIHNFSAGPAGRGEDGWTSATITLAAKAADSVVGNTLVIGAAGFPPYLQAANASDHFPSETAADSNNGSTAGPDVLWWAAPSAIGISNVEGNTGTTAVMATADVVGWTCNDADGNPATGPCSSASSFRARGNFENILLKITKDGGGNPIAVEGFLVQGGGGAVNPLTVPNWVAWTFQASTDTDGDGVADFTDNCMLVANPTQVDSNGDGYGNLCDADINNSNLVTATDFNLLRACINQPGYPTGTAQCQAADMNASGTVTATDFNLLRNRINTAPGPSGLSCAGTIPCSPP